MLLALSLVLAAKDRFPLTIESIMRGPALVGHAPRSLVWSADSSTLRFMWAKAEGKGDPPYRAYSVNRDGKGLGAPVPVSDLDRLSNRGEKWGNLQVYSESGSVTLRDLKTNQAKKLTEGDSPRFIEQGRAIGFMRGSNFFRFDLTDQKVTQLTQLQTDTVMPSAESSGTVIRVPSGFSRGEMTLSPSGTHVALELFQGAKGVRIANVPNYLARGGYTEMIPTYDKVGGPQPTSKILIEDLTSGAVKEINPMRPGRAFGLEWAPDGRHAVAWVAADDHKSSWIIGFDAATDTVTTYWEERDNAWVGGPGEGVLGWLPDSSRIYFESEKSGYANLYTMPATGGDATPLVSGDFEVSDLRLDAEHHRFTFVSSEGSPFRRHVDEVDFAGGARHKLADLSADEDATYAIAPNGKDIAVVRSKSNRPPELYINDVQVTQSPTDEFLAGPWIDPPIVMVPARDGSKVPARLFRPRNWRKGGPAVVFVHGAGYLQNVYEGWSHYFREYMFHHLLMSKGYAVLDMDFRASAGYGKAWRTAIYRHMGGKDLDDNVDGAQYLIKELGVAPDRIGIYGGSYGGFITLMAMFTSPNTFAAGAALRPVSDWKNYNHGYTSEILNTPSDDPVAYTQSSPINFVEGLKGALLICHGVIDTNVHYQDTMELTERLIELGKTNWQVAPYPEEDHAFRKPESWTDEYRRIFDLFERTIGKDRKKR